MERKRIVRVDTPEFERIWKLYLQSFPEYEQRILSDQTEAMTQPDYYVEEISQLSRFVGFMMYWMNKNFIYLEHFAVMPEMRGAGMGTKALHMLMAEGLPVILEIDPPKGEREEKRKKFYLGCGFEENEYKHIHPPYKSQFEGHKLELLSYPKKLAPEAYSQLLLYLTNRVMAFSE